MQQHQFLNEAAWATQGRRRSNLICANEDTLALYGRQEVQMEDLLTTADGTSGKDDTLKLFYKWLYPPSGRENFNGFTLENSYTNNIEKNVETGFDADTPSSCVDDKVQSTFPLKVGAVNVKHDLRGLGVYTPITPENFGSYGSDITNIGFLAKENNTTSLDLSYSLISSVATQTGPPLLTPRMEESDIGTGFHNTGRGNPLDKVYPTEDTVVQYNSGVSHVSEGVSKGNAMTSIVQQNNASVYGTNPSSSSLVLLGKAKNVGYAPHMQQAVNEVNNRQIFKPQFIIPEGIHRQKRTKEGFKKVQRPRGRKPSAMIDSSKGFVCSDCTARFRRLEHLKRHVRSLHSHERPFTCPMCLKNFSRNDNMKLHMKRHSDSPRMMVL